MVEHVNRRLTDEERQRHASIRAGVERDFPPKSSNSQAALPGIPATIRAAREEQGLTWYALAQMAGISEQATIRDIEQGKDVKLSHVEAVAKALGLSLQLVSADLAGTSSGQ